MGIAVLACCALVGTVALYGWLSAHTKPAPASIRPEVGPIARRYAVAPDALYRSIETAVAGVPGAKVAHRQPSELIVNVRPTLGRLDDGMGLFVAVRVDGDHQLSQYSMVGQAKSGVAIASTTSRALTSFERDLRLRLKQRCSLATIG